MKESVPKETAFCLGFSETNSLATYDTLYTETYKVIIFFFLE